MKKKQKIAIACQGGGSHTAFTAGVLKKLLEKGVHQTYDFVGLSGTSGGAICNEHRKIRFSLRGSAQNALMPFLSVTGIASSKTCYGPIADAPALRDKASEFILLRSSS